jgi:hypothetical protein
MEFFHCQQVGYTNQPFYMVCAVRGGTVRHHVPTHLAVLTIMVPTFSTTRAASYFWMRNLFRNSDWRKTSYLLTHRKRSSRPSLEPGNQSYSSVLLWSLRIDMATGNTAFTSSTALAYTACHVCQFQFRLRTPLQLSRHSICHQYTLWLCIWQIDCHHLSERHYWQIILLVPGPVEIKIISYQNAVILTMLIVTMHPLQQHLDGFHVKFLDMLAVVQYCNPAMSSCLHLHSLNVHGYTGHCFDHLNCDWSTEAELLLLRTASSLH